MIYLGANGDSTWSPGIASRTNVLEFTAGAADGSYSTNFVSANVTNILNGGTGTGIVTNMIDTGGATNTPSRYYRVRCWFAEWQLDERSREDRTVTKQQHQSRVPRLGEQSPAALPQHLTVVPNGFPVYCHQLEGL